MRRTLRLTARFVIRFVIGILVLLLAFAGYFAVQFQRGVPDWSGGATLPGLDAEVTVIRDSAGIPTIVADSETDAYRALGYIHARDRLWQMETTRRIGAGRLSEVIGRSGLRFDRYIRMLGLYRLAEAQVAALSAEARAVLDAYVEGVNAWLEARPEPLPPEFQLFFHDPEPWTAADSLVWGRLMAFRLSTNQRDEKLRAKLSNLLSTEQLFDLFPSMDDAPVSLPSPRDTAWLGIPETPDILTSKGASNAWVLSGDRTASGKPILANDPHLQFNAPNLWYLARIETPTLTLAGATVPGVPFHILGHNGNIAWGLTTTYADTQDMFVETVSADGLQYKTENGWKDIAVTTETIGVRFGGDEILTVRSTRHGPIVSDLSNEPPPEGVAVALSFTGLRDDDTTPEALFRLNRARNKDEFLAAMRLYKSPVQNIHYADIDGHTGLIAAGLIPIRKSGNGLTPVDGASGRYDWLGFIPFEELPQRFDPPGGAIVSANNRLVDDGYPYLVAAQWPSGFRARRLQGLIGGAPTSTAAQSRLWQQDIFSPAAALLVPYLLPLKPGDGLARAALALLRGWDFRMTRDSPAPLIYAAWLDRLVPRIAADELGEALPRSWNERELFVDRVFDKRQVWCDDVGTPDTETCAETALLALEDALSGLAAKYGGDPAVWRWGDAHVARFNHRFLGQLPLLGPMVNLAIETDGGDNTVNRGQTGADRDNPFQHIHGAGYRAIYDFANLDQSLFSLAGGQSGHFLSPHYRDLLTGWRDGDYFQLPASSDSKPDPEDIFVFTPE